MIKQLFCILAMSAVAFAPVAQVSRVAVPTAGGLKQTGREMPAAVKAKRAARAVENAISVPFSYAMGKDSPDADYIKANFTVINANEDSRTWNVCTTNKYSSCMAAKSGESERADDWLITPPINLTAGSYKLSFDGGYMGASANGYSLEIFLGTAPEVADMNKIIAPEVLYTAKDQTTYQYDFSVDTDGVYYIGFHCTTSVSDAGATLLYNFGVESNGGSVSVPENAVEVPFKHELGKDSPDADFVKDNYTVLNVNGDNRKWQVASVNGYSACMAPNDDNVDANDDWLITMPVHMTAGSYIVSADMGYMSGTGIIMEMKLGNDTTAEAMTIDVMPVTTITDKDQTTYQFNVSVPTDGYYYLGVHCLTTKDLKSAAKLFNVSITPGEVTVIDPPAAGTLTWELAPKGELKATVTYTAPTKTVSGADLESISKVELTSRWTVDKYEFTDVVPGQVIVQEVPMYQGINNRFTGVAYVGDTPGEMVEYKSIFCGKDTPLAPENVHLTTNSDYTSATLTWDAVSEVGENGGYVDPETVTYYIFDAFGSYYDPAIAETNETSITLDFSNLNGQDFVAYQVTAGYEDYYSLDNSSNIVIVGTPDKTPFIESFGKGLYENLWALDPETDYYYQQYGTITDDYFAGLVDSDDPDAPAPLKSFDGDNGFFYWLPMEKDVMVGLMSVRTDISKAANPVLEFRYQGQGSTIDVLVASGTGELKLVKSISLKENPTVDGWALASVPLSEYKADGAVNFEIRLTATDNDDEHTWSVPIDYIVVRDLVDKDVRLVSVAASAVKAAPGSDVTFRAVVHNEGREDIDTSVGLEINGTLIVSNNLGVLAADAFATTDFVYTVPFDAPDNINVRVVAIADGDMIADNNDYSCDIAVQHLPYPTVGNLSAQANGSFTSVVLNWDAPQFDNVEPQTVLEDFESSDYEPMSISGVGGWTVYDGDGEITINVFYETYNPYQTAPMAFQLFNRELANPEYWEDAQPHSGNSFMLAPTSYYADNDNWLISPRLSGNEQTVSFYAKSFSSAWPESLEVRYSTTGNTAPDNFEADPILTVEPVEVGWFYEGGVPEVWTKYEVTLPAGAQHFAIRHYGWYTCALFIDDVTFEAAPDIPADLEVLGYHVMRDGAFLTQEPIAATTFEDVLPAVAQDVVYTYTVLPVYNYGIGRGESVTVQVSTSVTDIIDISDLDGTETIFNLQGIRVNKPAVPGIYIRNGQKIMLR